MAVRMIWRCVALCAAVAVLAPIASAQVYLDAQGILPKKNAPPPPPPRAPPTVWPRLDPGAVFCRTDDDLSRHSANMTARVGGSDVYRADCRIISEPVGVQILSRQGPGRTQVKLAGVGNVTGWTDVWLPDKAPAGR